MPKFIDLYFWKSYYPGHIPTKQKTYIAEKKKLPNQHVKEKVLYLFHKNFQNWVMPFHFKKCMCESARSFCCFMSLLIRIVIIAIVIIVTANYIQSFCSMELYFLSHFPLFMHRNWYLLLAFCAFPFGYSTPHFYEDMLW